MISLYDCESNFSLRILTSSIRASHQIPPSDIRERWRSLGAIIAAIFETLRSSHCCHILEREIQHSLCIAGVVVNRRCVADLSEDPLPDTMAGEGRIAAAITGGEEEKQKRISIFFWGFLFARTDRGFCCYRVVGVGYKSCLTEKRGSLS